MVQAYRQGPGLGVRQQIGVGGVEGAEQSACLVGAGEVLAFAAGSLRSRIFSAADLILPEIVSQRAFLV